MDDVYYNDPDLPDQVDSNTEDSANEAYEPLRWPIQAPIVDVFKPESIHSPQKFDVSEPNSCKQKSQQKFFSATQMLLIVAVTIFATLSIVLMVMYFMAEGKSKPCNCQNSNIKDMKETSEPCDGQNTSRNRTEQKCKHCVYQNFSFVTNSSKSKNYSMGNGQWHVDYVQNSTIRKYTDQNNNDKKNPFYKIYIRAVL